MSNGDHIRTLELHGYRVTIDDKLGKLAVEHNGDITWDELQAIKGMVWGREARAIEVYPAASGVVNTINCRHLWRLGARDFCPDLLGPISADDGLKVRFDRAWAGAWAC